MEKVKKNRFWLRRVYYLVWIIAGIKTVFPIVLPAVVGLVNLAYPQRNKWKTRLLLVAYLPFLPLMLLNMYEYRSFYYLALPPIYFGLAAWKRLRPAVFVASLALTAWLFLASYCRAHGGGVLLVGASLALGAAVFLLVRRGAYRSLIEAPEDLVVHFCLISTALVSWFFFFPAPFPSAWLEKQEGVTVEAACDTSRPYRDAFFGCQINMVDALAPGELLISTKRRAPEVLTHFETYRLQTATGTITPETGARTITTDHLVRCPAERIIRQEKIEKNVLSMPIVLRKKDAQFPMVTGFCLDRSGLLAIGNHYRADIIDQATGQSVFTLERAAIRQPYAMPTLAPFGGGKIAHFADRTLAWGEYLPAGGRFYLQSSYDLSVKFHGETILLGHPDIPFVYLVRAEGHVWKIAPPTEQILASGTIRPGFRFAAYDRDLHALFVTNDLLGIVEVLDGETLAHLDTLYVGHAARRLNISPFEPGIGHIVSAAGVLRIDFCRRLPAHCAARPFNVGEEN